MIDWLKCRFEELKYEYLLLQHGYYINHDLYKNINKNKKAIITVGISGSGKTTFAEQQKGYLIVSRDDMREQYIKKHYCKNGYNQDIFLFFMDKFPKEGLINHIQKGLILRYAKKGLDLILADTNINKNDRKKHVKLLKKYGYEIEYKVFKIELEVALEQNRNRLRVVPEQVIKEQYERLSRQQIYQ